uniref:ADP/ATP translocase n=1 Tax=Caenorhabditis japonica TaxID=281687 RepID=A0A8R1HVT7_CAEJA
MSIYTAVPGLSRDDVVKFSKDFLAGATAAAISKTVIAPVERVKLILQLQNSQKTLAHENRYKGIVDCFIRVPREQGFISFWRGNWVNILRSCSQESLGISFKEFFRKYSLENVNPETQHTRWLAGNLVAGGGSGCATLATIYPLDFIRTRLAIDLGKHKSDREFTGMFDCARKIIKSDGVRGLYKGLVPSLQYMIIYRGAYYGLFDTTAPYMNRDGKMTFTQAFLVGQVVTLIASHDIVSAGHCQETAYDGRRKQGYSISQYNIVY